jgi:hypothetical protein
MEAVRPAWAGPMTATEAEMYALAGHLGIHVARQRLSGRPRYRFFSIPTDFFAGDGMGTVIGTRAALTWLRGYEAARLLADDHMQAS